MVTQHSIHKYKNTRDDEKEKPPQKKKGQEKDSSKPTLGHLIISLLFTLLLQSK